jgi:anti-sigma factor RsiW
MRPCAKNRKWIAWLALGALDARRAEELRAHLEACEGCRRYFEETSRLGRVLKEAGTSTDLEPSDSFHRAVARAVRADADQRGSIRRGLAALARMASLKRGAALAVLGAAVIAIAALPVLVSRFGSRGLTRPGPSWARTVPAPSLDSELAPTLANYELVASRSLEEFDELLTRQANRRHSPALLYTASSLILADSSE